MHVPDFAHSRAFTLGVELEFQILDRQTLDLASVAPRILAQFGAEQQPFIVQEFLQSIIEVQTGVCDDVGQVAADLGQRIQLVEAAAAREHCLLYAASLHPFARPEAQQLSDDPRYHRIMEELQQVGRQFISQGLHVHVGMAHREDAIAVCDGATPYLPVLLALSASSPYFQGTDTGFASFRTKLFEMLPMAGIGSFLGSWQGYVDEITMLGDRGIIHEVRDLWWDIRPSPGFGTVEVRICDLPASLQEILGLVSLVQGLCAAILDRPRLRRLISPQLLAANKWQAARHGLAGIFHDPLGLLATKPLTMAEAAKKLRTLVKPWLDTLHGFQYIQGVQRILEQGSSADRQRRLMHRFADYRKMMQTLQQEFWT